MGLLVVGAIDPEAAILRIHIVSQVPQELLVLAEDFSGAADGERGKPAPPYQAARARGIAWGQFHGNRAANSVIL